MLPELITEDRTAVAVSEHLPEAVVETKMAVDGAVIYVRAEHIVPVCRFLRESGFERLSAVTGVDWWPRTPRFEVIYFLHSLSSNQRVRLAVRMGENEQLPSVCSVWRGANWYEREIFDLFGIVFGDHPNLERILMPADWEGFPLRKDYPIHGHKYSYSEE